MRGFPLATHLTVEKPYILNKKRGPMESVPTDRTRDAGKATHTEERLDLVERMRNKKSNKAVVPQNMVMVLLYTVTFYSNFTVLYYS